METQHTHDCPTSQMQQAHIAEQPLIDAVRQTIARASPRKDPLADKVFFTLVEPIITNGEFFKTLHFKHHHTSIFEHCLFVSYYSYLLARKLKLDAASTARGALLHDFFLYEWRKGHPVRGVSHGREHPRTALRNARRQFPLNPVEHDIILRHMWPRTLALPRYKETFLVVLVDKHLATLEFCREARSIISAGLSSLRPAMRRLRKRHRATP